jgi:WD40 repeat protein
MIDQTLGMISQKRHHDFIKTSSIVETAIIIRNPFLHWDVDVSKDGDYIAYSDDKKIYILFADSLNLMMSFDHGLDSVTCLKFDIFENRIFCGDQSGIFKCFEFYDNYLHPQIVSCYQEEMHQNAILCVDISKNFIVTGSRDSEVHLRLRKNFNLLQKWNSHTLDIHDVLISSDENIVISGSKDQNIIIWDVKEKTKKMRIHKSYSIWCLKWTSHEIHFLVGYCNGAIEKLSILDGNLWNY